MQQFSHAVETIKLTFDLDSCKFSQRSHSKISLHWQTLAVAKSRLAACLGVINGRHCSGHVSTYCVWLEIFCALN